jgi:hypothetical protein
MDNSFAIVGIVFSVLFCVPASAKMVKELSIDSTPLQWLLTGGFVLLCAIIIGLSISAFY